MSDKTQKLTVSIASANIFGLILFVVSAFLVGALWYLLYGNITITDAGSVLALSHSRLAAFLPIVMLLCFVDGVFLHELIHGFFFSLFADKHWRSIHLGVMWKVFTPYCHCDEPLRKNQYIIGVLAPMVILGLMPLVLGFYFRDIFVVAWGVIFIDAAAGDILIAWKLRNLASSSMVLDHPKEPGCIIYD